MNERIKKIRKELHMTQQEFATSLNVSKSTVEGYEYGKLNVTDRVIAYICTVYNVSEEWLRTGNGDMFKPISRETEIARIVNEIIDAPDDDFKLNLTKILYAMTPEEINVLKNIALKMALATKKEDQ